MSWRKAATTDEIEPGGVKILELAGKEIGVFHVGGDSDDYRAVLNFCPHAGAPICKGRVSGLVTSDEHGRVGYDHDRRILRCPWHHWEFDLETGQAITPVRQKLKTYPVKVEGDEILVDL